LQVDQRINLKIYVDLLVSILTVEQYDATVDCAEDFGGENLIGTLI